MVGRPFEIQQSQMIAMRPYMVWELMHKRLHRAESSRESVPWRSVSCHPWASTTWCLRRLKIYSTTPSVGSRGAWENLYIDKV